MLLIAFLDKPIESNDVYEPADTEHATSEQVQHAPRRSLHVELMQTEESKWYQIHVGVI